MAGGPSNYANRAETLIHANIYELPNPFGKLKGREAPVAAQKQMAEGRVAQSNCCARRLHPNALTSESFR
jgi:hypothetical protein